MELSTRPFKIEWWNFSSEPDEALLRNAATNSVSTSDFDIRNFRSFDLVPLSRDLVHGLKDYMVSQLPGKDPWMDWEPYTSRLIFVFCEPKDPLVHVFQQENPLAHWGVAIPAQFSIAWHYDHYSDMARADASVQRQRLLQQIWHQQVFFRKLFDASRSVEIALAE